MAVMLTQRNLSVARQQASAPRKGGNEISLGAEAEAGQSGPAVTEQPDDGVARILKMVPGEASAAYTASLALDTDSKYLPALAFVLCAILIPMLLRRDGLRYSPPVTPEPRQYAFQLLAFTAWAFSIHNPLEGFGVQVSAWIPALAILFIPIFGGLMPVETPDEKPAPITS